MVFVCVSKKSMGPVTVMEVFFLLLSLYIIHHAHGEQCRFHAPCSCDTDDYKINLLPMMENNRDPLHVLVGATNYYLNPCGRTITLPACKSLGATASGCQEQGGAYGIASTSGYTATGDPFAGTVTFTYSYGESTEKRTTKVKLQCASDDRDFRFDGEHPQRTYNFVLKTKYACKEVPSSGGSGGLSTGSILVILFFVFLLIYIIAGILFMKYYRKAEGIELVPNLAFWKEIPFLIKDGVVFTISKFKKDSTYDRI